MTRFDTRLLPPDDEDEFRPERRAVWRAAFRELGLLGALALVALVGLGGVVLGTEQRLLVGTGMALLPVGVWLVSSYRVERQVQRPRPALFRLLLMSMLVANAVTAPFVEGVVEPERWLNSAPLVTRIVGTMLTVGLVTEFSKLLVMRVMVWPDVFERRVDAVAYSIVAGLGFATVFNLRFVFVQGGGQPAAAALHIVSVVLMQQAIGLLMGNGLMALKKERTQPFNLVLYLLGGAFLHGLYVVIRTGVVVRGFGVGAVANSPFLGLVFGVMFPLVVYGAVAFLMANADARDEQLASGPGEVRYSRGAE